MKPLALPLAASLALAPALAPAQTAATEPFAQPPPRAAQGPVERRVSTLTTAGLRFDAGAAYSYGAGFLRVREDFRGRRGGLGGSVWWGGGLDVRAVSRDGGTLDAVQVNAVGRLSFLGCSGAGFEATVGVAQAVGGGANGAGGGTVPVGSLGAFMGVHYVLVGYSYQVPLGPFDRPDWLASHQFSVRVEIPVMRGPEHVTHEP